MKRIIKESLSKENAQALLTSEIRAKKEEAVVRASQLEAARALAEAQRAVHAEAARRLQGSEGTISEQGLLHLNVMSAVADYKCVAAGQRSVANVHLACQEKPRLEDIGSVPDCSAEASLSAASYAAASCGLKIEHGVLKVDGFDSRKSGSMLIPEVYGKPVSGAVTERAAHLQSSRRRVYTTNLSIGAITSNGKAPGRKADRVGALLATFVSSAANLRCPLCLSALFSRRPRFATFLLGATGRRPGAKRCSDMHSRRGCKCVFHLFHCAWNRFSDRFN